MATATATRPGLSWTEITDVRDPAYAPGRYEAPCHGHAAVMRVHRFIAAGRLAGPDGHTTRWHFWPSNSSPRFFAQRAN